LPVQKLDLQGAEKLHAHGKPIKDLKIKAHYLFVNINLITESLVSDKNFIIF
jgi:hypothetical protein